MVFPGLVIPGLVIFGLVIRRARALDQDALHDVSQRTLALLCAPGVSPATSPLLADE